MPETTGAQRKRAAEVKPYNIYEDSDILVSTSNHTLVPRLSVLFVPAGLEGRVAKTKPNTPFVVYANFFKDHGGTFTTYEVSMDQALGKAPLDKERLISKWTNEGKIVVATYQNHPVSVQPYKDPKLGQDQANQPKTN